MSVPEINFLYIFNLENMLLSVLMVISRAARLIEHEIKKLLALQKCDYLLGLFYGNNLL